MNDTDPEKHKTQTVLTIGRLSVDTFPANILMEDNHLLGVFKPAGMLTQGDRSGEPSLLDIARDWLKIHYRKPGRVFLGMVHRLDRPVCGVVLFARTSKAAGRLAEQFRNRNIRKTYHALVQGFPNPPEGVIEQNLVREGAKTMIAPSGRTDGQRARLAYRILERGKTCCLMEIDLQTGRKHQIRAQLAALGYPIIGDGLYGSTVSLAGETIALQAHSLVFTHPTRKEECILTSPVPLTQMFPEIE